MLFYLIVYVILKIVYYIWNIEGNKCRKGILLYVNNIFFNCYENVLVIRVLFFLKKIFRIWIGNCEIFKVEWDFVICVRNYS